MRRRTRSTNPEVPRLVSLLRKGSRHNRCAVWREVADELEKSRRLRAIVNLDRLARYTVDGQIVAVPGKILGSGLIDHKVTVAALRFSPEARRKIEKVGGKCLCFDELLKENPKGSGVAVFR